MSLSKQELIDKKNELDKQISTLLDFTLISPKFKALSEDDKNKWRNQLSAMGDMSKVLSERIEAFDTTE